MKTISFAWTTPALLAGRKTCTRRDWSPEYAARFRQGEFIAAWSKQPRFHGARQIAVIRLTETPRLESTRDAPESDYVAEGFDYLTEIGAKVDGLPPIHLWRAWHMFPQEMWVVRFDLVRVLEAPPAVANPQGALL